jgi:serine phosphatase RsbU (regulator of sigma subunit)
MNEARDFFGDERLRAALVQSRGQRAAAVGQAVVDAVARFVGDAPVHDDVSLVVLRRT